MRKALPYILFGLLFYVVFLVVQFPAAIAYAWLAPSASGAPQLAGISGSVWRGQAERLVIDGRVLEGFHWRLHVLPLLFGQVEAGIGFRVNGGFAEGTVGASLAGVVAIEDAHGQLPASVVGQWLGLRGLQPDGAVSLLITRAKIDARKLMMLEGSLLWSDAKIDVLKPLLLGDLKVDMVPVDQGMLGTFSDGGGPVQLGGTILIREDGSYALSATLAARPGAPADLAQALATLGRPDNRGQVTISQVGNIPLPGVGPH